MNNIWIAALFAIIVVVVGYLLTLATQWPIYSWVGFILAIVIVVGYVFNRNRRIQ